VAHTQGTIKLHGNVEDRQRFRTDGVLDRAAIAKKVGVGWSIANATLWKARTKLGCETLERTWEVAQEFIEANLHWLPLAGRKRKPNAIARDVPLLTSAQAKLLAVLHGGAKPKDAGEELAISIDTVYVQLRNCRARLGAATTAEAAAKALDLGLI
jgi:DNA-binding CsgD family transcriptional regulator